MATVGKMIAILTAHTQPFEKRMHGSTRSVYGLQKGIASARRMIMGFGGALLGVAGAGGMAMMVRSTMKAIDQLAKTSDKLGIATEDLGRFHYAAQLSGIAINTFDMALQRMIRRIAEAAQGTGEAKAAIKELGLGARALATAGPAEALRMIAEAMMKVENQADRVRLAFKLFDSEGVAMVNMLMEGRGGLEMMAAEADKLGITFDRFAAAKVEAANDALTRMKLRMTALWQSIAIQLAPGIEMLSNKFLGMGVAAEAGATRAGLSMSWLGKTIGFIGDLFWAVGRTFDYLAMRVLDRIKTIATVLHKLGLLSQKELFAISAAAHKFAKDFNDAMVEMSPSEKMQAHLVELERQIAELNRTVDAASDPMAAFGDAVGTLEQRLQLAIDTFGMSANEIAIYKLALQGATEAQLAHARALAAQLDLLQKQADLASEAQSIWEKTRTPLERYEAQIDKLNRMLELHKKTAGSAGIDFETYSRAVRMAREELEKAAETRERFAAASGGRAGEFREVRLSRMALEHTYGSRGEKDADERSLKMIKDFKEEVERNLGKFLTEGVVIRLDEGD